VRESTACRSLPSQSSHRLRRALVAGLALCLAAPLLAAADGPPVQGSLVANEATIELPYVYLWAEEEGL